MVKVDITRLRPPPPPNGVIGEHGQCEYTLAEMSYGAATQRHASWRVEAAKKRGRIWDHCWQGAAIELNGRKLCLKHAGTEALKLLLGKDK